ncbi:CHAT domain-containing protein [Streptomyces mirabilis]|uniref:CHAT domain-containing protein n=1 Tax=Streptomyces mirabilis TaxID=68239 RepID=UPI0036942E43
MQEGHEAPVCLEVGSAWGFDKTMKKYLLALDDVSSETREQIVRETLEQFHPMFRALPWYLFGNDFDPAAADGPPRVWWCPSGLLSMLPLHAATSFPHEGRDFVPGPEIKIARAYGARDTWKPDASARQRITGSSCLLDTMASSYTPTIRSLVWAREVRDAEPAADPAQDPRMMLVASNSDSGLESLPGTQGVRTHLQKLLSPNRLTLLTGRDATVRRVTREFHHHDAAHFDCHSLRDPDDPWRSGLSLHDRPLTVEDLIERRVDRLDFAYLAACATALTDEQVPDEMITLTAALHYTGCPHVIGTLTPSTDRSTARVTRSLYSSLVREDGLLDPTDCARLLHAAVGAERARMPDRPSAWSPFIHIGI